MIPHQRNTTKFPTVNNEPTYKGWGQNIGGQAAGIVELSRKSEKKHCRLHFLPIEGPKT